MKTFWSMAALLLLPVFAVADDPQFMRLKKTDGKVTGMEIAITRYVNNDKSVLVDLVGVVHIGDAEYYRRLNNGFKNYDAVLYELVAPEGTKVEKGRKAGMLKKVMNFALDLSDQLEQIDYSASNFVHADLSFDGMKKAMATRGDNEMTVMLSMLVENMRKNNLAKNNGQQQQDEFAELLQDPNVLNKILSNPNHLKRIMAKQMTDNSSLGTTINTVLVEDRNKEACRVLSREMKDGKKKLAIFYGAAHMPDFHQRLTKMHGLTMERQHWLTAWDMTGEEMDPELRLLKMLMSK